MSRFLFRKSFGLVWLIALTGLLSRQACGEEARIWTDKSGMHEIRAKYIDVKDGKVRLERPNGDITRIPLNKLCEDDQEYVRNGKAGPDKTEPPNPTGPRKLAIGDRVDAEHFGEWYPGVVIKIDYFAEHANVRLDNGKTAHFCGEDELRWPGTRESPLIEPHIDPALTNLKVVEPDTSDMVRVTADGDAASTAPADPMPSPQSGWKPKAVRLDGAANVHIRIEDFSAVCESRPLAALLSTDPFNKAGSPQIELVDLATRKVLLNGPGLPYTTRVVLSPSGNRIATLSTGKSSSDSEGRIDVWKLAGKKVSHVIGFSPYSGESWSTIDSDWIAWLDDEYLFTTNSEGRTYLWQADQAKAVYEVLTDRHTIPALSPGRKYLAVPSVNGIDLFDALSGSIVANVGSGNMRSANLAYSPSGRQIAAVSSGFVDVVDVTTGELTRSFPCEKISGRQGLTWADEDYLLVDNQSLIHVPLRILAWKFQITSNTSATAGGIPWIVLSSGQKRARTITPLLLPPPGVTKAIEKLDDSEMLAVQPGAEVAVKAEIRDRTLALAVTNALKEAAQEAGMQVTDEAALVLRATMKKGKTEQINYRGFHDHFGKGETINVTQRIFELQLLQNGSKIWQRESVQTSPMHVRMEKGENIQAAINRIMRPTAGSFRGRLPNYIVRPEFQGPLGTSTISAR